MFSYRNIFSSSFVISSCPRKIEITIIPASTGQTALTASHTESEATTLYFYYSKSVKTILTDVYKRQVQGNDIGFAWDKWESEFREMCIRDRNTIMK